MAARIIPGDENDGAFQTGLSQALHARIKELLPDLFAPIRGRHGQMINPAAPSIVTAKSDPGDFTVNLGDVKMYSSTGNHDVRWNPRGKEGYVKGTGQPLYQSWD